MKATIANGKKIFCILWAGRSTSLALLCFFACITYILASSFAGVFAAFQEPAFSATLSLLLPKEEYTRSNGLLGLGRSASRIFAPILAGLLLPAAVLNAVMAADLATLALAVLGLLFVRLPPVRLLSPSLRYKEQV